MLDLLVLADDRTGALETAGACSDAGWGGVSVVVAPDVPPVGARVAVVDIGSRHLDAMDGAAAAVAAARACTSRSTAHKIDSTLRGNWAAEVVARQAATGGRVLVVAAFPAVGRTCVGGIVHVDGAPLAIGDHTDARRGPASNRPADLLIAAGAAAVAPLTGAAEVAAWASLADSPRFAVCDVATNGDLTAVGRAWGQLDGVLLAGTAGAIGAGAAALATAPIASAAVPLVPPVLVVCGSLHPTARRQVAALGGLAQIVVPEPDGDVGSLAAALRADGLVVLQTPPASGSVGGHAAADLARTVHRLVEVADVRTIVIIGGDTAAAVLGVEPVIVGGTVAPGMPWGRWVSGGPLLVTKAGGFGDDHTLVRLLPGRMEP